MRLAPIPGYLLKTTVTIVIGTGQSVYGVTTNTTVTGYCRYDEKSIKKIDAEKRLISLSGVIFMNGDIAPSLPVIESGTVTIGGKTWEIYSAERPRNPDGSVHHTEIFLR